MERYTEIIDKYLHGEMTSEEKRNFEAELQSNVELKKELEIQKEVMKGIEQYGLKAEINQSLKSAKINKLIKKVAFATVTIAVVALGVYYIKERISKAQRDNIHYEKSENGDTNWSEVDKALESQFHKINAQRDTIIETKAGILFQIQANTFLDKYGEVPTEVSIEVKEAMSASDIIKAGLSTMSNDRLLETGGMFYINARVGEEVLTISQGKQIKVAVPSTDNKKMSLFDGERTKDGGINWVNPKQTKRQLTTVDILSLDFYPPGFLDSLNVMGFDIKNKKLTDSIYYSFSSWMICETFCEENYDYGIEQTRLQPVPKTKDATSAKSIIHAQPDGEKLFQRNCAVCHTMTDEILTGPGLAGVTDRVPVGNWLKNYILNNERMIKAGDPYAVKIYNQYKKAAMTVFEGALTDNEVNAIIKYIGRNSSVNYSTEQSVCCPEINPSRIGAIWDRKFNNTILATKEFEERLKVIFSTCNKNIFNLYAQNLNSELWELDSIAAFVYGGTTKQKFLDFYKRKDAGVEISDEQELALQKYQREKKELYDKAVRKVMTELYGKEQKQKEDAEAHRYEYNSDRSLTSAKLVVEEIEANLDEAYRQLGKKRPTAPPPNVYVTGSIDSPGWKNVDRYVIEATVSRSTLDYTDPDTGKKAMIEYKEARVEIKDYDKYDRVVCYLLPDKLSSFQLMKNVQGVFSEKLNQTFSYAMIVVGYKGDKVYFHEVNSVKPKEYKVKLLKIDEDELAKRIDARYSFSEKKDIIKDLYFSKFEHAEAKREAKIMERELLRTRIERAVYPCNHVEFTDGPDQAF